MASHSSLWQLYLARLREFYRQPARIFWVYGFPIVLAIVLGLAFNSGRAASRSSSTSSTPREPAEVVSLMERRPGGRDVVVRNLVGDGGGAARPAPRPGRRWSSSRRRAEAVAYRYDPTRPEALVARAAFDDAYQRALGREDVAETTELIVDEPGSRYIDFLIPGLIGLNAMGGGLWGIGLPAGQLPDRQAPEAVRGDADAPAELPAGDPRVAADVPDPRPLRPAEPRGLRLRDADPREPRPGGPGRRGRGPGVRGDRPADRQPGAGDARRSAA